MPIIDNIKDKISEVFTPEQLTEQEIKISDGDEILLPKLKFRKKHSKDLLKPKLDQWEKNIRFFKGEHWQIAGITMPTYKANIVVNKWFAAVRSLVAFETDSKPDPIIEAQVRPDTEDSEEIIKQTKKLESSLDYCWHKRQIPSILTQIYYDRYNMDDGFGMYFWNNEIDDVDFEQIKPYELLIAPGATCIEDAEYLIVKKQRNRKWFETYFPEKADKIKFVEPKREISDLYDDDETAKKGYENMADVYHYFEDDIWITFTDTEVLEKMDNPYWEWRTEEEQRTELAAKTKNKIPTGWKPVRNHLIKPEKPIVHFKGYHTGGQFYSNSLVRQAFELNIAINKRKCQIQDNADGMANPQKIVDPSVPKDKVDMITSEPGLKVRVNPSLYRTEPGAPLPEFVFTDLQHSEQKFDDMVGHHEVSRGATASKRQTAREALMLRETDITPVRLLMRNSEVAMTKLLNGWVQLKKLFYDQAHYIGRTGTSLREETGTILKREEIPDNLSLIIKVGSTLPTSKETKRAELFRDLQLGVIDPQTYLEEMAYPNPEKILRRLINFKQGIISDEEPQQGQPFSLGGGTTPTGGETTPAQPPQPTGGI